MNIASLPRPLAMVFTNGSARTPAQIGMLEALSDLSVFADLAIGSSLGAINAAVYASDPEGAPELLIPLWRTMSTDSALSSTWRNAVRGVSKKQSARTAEMLRRHLTGVLGQGNMNELKIPLCVVATDLESGQPVNIDNGLVVDAVMTSSAFPVVMPPVPTRDGYLIDGSASAGFPISQAIEAGAKSAIVLDAGGSAIPEVQARELGWFGVMAMAFAHLVRGQAAHDLAEAATTIPVIVMSCEQGNPTDFKASTTNVDAGRSAARHALELLPRRTSSWPAGVYGHVGAMELDERIRPLIRPRIHR